MKRSIENFKNKQPDKIKIKILKGILNKDELGKPFIEYIIDISYNSQNWRVNKKFNAFSNLHKTLKSLFKDNSEIKMPESSSIFSNLNINDSNSTFHENKIKILESYLKEISEIGVINKSKPFRKFFEFDEYYDEDNNKPHEIEIINKRDTNNASSNDYDDLFNSSSENVEDVKVDNENNNEKIECDYKENDEMNNENNNKKEVLINYRKKDITSILYLTM
jgi:hypothetical protein